MSVKDLLNNLELKPKAEGSQLVIDCMMCGKRRTWQAINQQEGVSNG